MPGQHLALYRTPEGRPVVLSDLCVHRGAALSGGTARAIASFVLIMAGNTRLMGSARKSRRTRPAGRSRARPASTPTLCRKSTASSGSSLAICRKPSVRRCRSCPNSTTSTRTAAVPQIKGDFLWRANYERILENGCDVAHGPFVHAGSFGDPDDPEVPDYEV